MIYVATVHFGSPRWIDVQLGYLHRNLREPFRIYANLENVPGHHAEKFTRVVPAGGQHSGKLNLIAAEVASEAKPSDLIVFLDGDAFPVADPMPTVRRALEESSLVAIRRDENLGDPQPHPSFCVMTVEEWERLHGDWSAGHLWEDGNGELKTDVGANLLRILDRGSTPWTPLLRSNRVNWHPVWFGVYGNVIYHHGAGFRQPMSRVDQAQQSSTSGFGTRLPVVGRVVGRALQARRSRWKQATIREARERGDALYDQIVSDPQFFRQFVD